MKRYLILIGFLAFTFSGTAQNISKKEKQILSFVEKNYTEFLKLLEQTVNINSGTNNLAGVREVGKIAERRV